jgi:aspartate aminotransferase
MFTLAHTYFFVFESRSHTHADSSQAAKDGSVFMFHACAHNPTGVDPTIEQWKEISALCKAKGHSVFMDSAYQGFASGDADKDAASIRIFVADGNDVCVAQSFAKNVRIVSYFM